MPRFIHVANTHIAGEKKRCWEIQKSGGYVPIGFTEQNLTRKSIEEVEESLEELGSKAKTTFRRFLSLEKGDIVIVPNGAQGIFGIGEISGECEFETRKHLAGYEENGDANYYSHYRNVSWLISFDNLPKGYLSTSELYQKGDTKLYLMGTTGKLYDEVPKCIQRLLSSEENFNKVEGKKEEVKTIDSEIVEIPEFLNDTLKEIEVLRDLQQYHSEKAHEVLVESLLVKLGYEKHKEIRYQVRKADICVFIENEKSEKCLIAVEVKSDWGMNSMTCHPAVKQCYGYATELGARYVIATNGNFYEVYDRTKGLSVDENYIGDFSLTKMTKEGLDLIEILKKQNS